MKIIEEDTFYECEKLKSAVFPKALEKIGLFAFFKTGLESFKSPISLREVAQGAFAECKSLITVELNEGLEALGTDEHPDGDRNQMYYGVFEESSLERVELPSTLRIIEYCAFENCKNLKDIQFPDSLWYIGKYCFWKSGLQTI